jgi:hypothetical protein
MLSSVLFWVVQRNAETGAAITFRSFEDYADAERHKVELDETAVPDDKTSEATIETLIIPQSPK